eukprot:912235-Rhodomonas_salina.3
MGCDVQLLPGRECERIVGCVALQNQVPATLAEPSHKEVKQTPTTQNNNPHAGGEGRHVIP